MNANQVYQSLDSLDKKQPVEMDKDYFHMLHQKDLVAVLSSHDYTVRHEETVRLPELEHDITALNSSLGVKRFNYARLDEKLKSGWHMAFSYATHLGDGGIVTEQNRLSGLHEEISIGEQNLRHMQAEKTRLETVKKSIDGYVQTSHGYMKATDKGKKVLRQLAARSSRLDGLSYGAFEHDAEKVEAAINSRYKKFLETYEFLKGNGFDNDSHTEQFAMSLSGHDMPIKQAYEKATKIDVALEKALNEKYQYSRKDKDRLKIISVLLGMPGDVNENVARLESLFAIALNHNNSNTYGTLFEQAMTLKVPLATPKQQFDRFDKMQDALNERQWHKGRSATCYIAANLAKKEGDVVQIADEFRTLEKKLVEKGCRNSVESGIAALVLLDAPGTHDEKAERFVNAFDTMLKYGWRNDTDYYAPAAVISLMPLSVEENVLWLDDVTELMKKDGFKYNLTQNALPIVSGGFKELFTDDSMPAYVSSHSSYDYESHHSSDLFSSGISMFDTSSILSNSVFSGGGGSFGGGGASGSW